MRGWPHSAALTHHVNTITHFVLSQPLLASSHQQLATVPDRPRRSTPARYNMPRRSTPARYNMPRRSSPARYNMPRRSA